ncbi:ATP-binding protein [Antarcticibacterium sp. 1MA-6-2]|uniref:AlbA family DNA-binding domain-containing protein n=1 Tax=Antarcticibacterium sp. 1MA-6-2 TaxID=2908210 RepID=UPI001F26A399|nr:ATP-binding protein [Antarcticibacterium sp. 1MA-6-2]UJH91907.1 ATP-binding protein [Antarcticibacterium sp. 1MA-6-2]
MKNLLFGCLGISLALMFYTRKKIFQLGKLKNEMDIVEALITEGENQGVEFKSTLRWDLRQLKPNKALENVVAKTIVSFMNCKGGNLLIGIDDEGLVLGLKEDYQTVKKPGRDGFEQYIMQLVSVTLGTRFCSLVKVTFYKFERRDICHLNIKSSKTQVFLNVGDLVPFFYPYRKRQTRTGYS